MSYLPHQPQHIPYVEQPARRRQKLQRRQRTGQRLRDEHQRWSAHETSRGMSVAVGALIASGSLVLSAVVHRMTLIQDDLIAIGMAVIPVGLTLISALVLAGYSWWRRRRGLTLHPARIWLIICSVVGVPVLAVASHSIPYLLGADSEYGQAAIAIICLYLMLHGWWIALVISAGIAVGVGIHRRQTTAR